MELVLKSLSAREVHLANTSVLQLGDLVFLVGWWFCLGFFGILCKCKNVIWIHVQTQSGKKNGE